MELNWQPHVHRARRAEVSPAPPHWAELLDQLTHCGIVVVDGGRKVLGFNAVAEAMTGLKTGEAVSLDAWPTALRGFISEALLSGRPNRCDQLMLQRAPNDETTVSVNVSPIQDVGGTGLGVIATLHDVSAVAMLNQHIRRLDQLASIGTLSASMAHEIKNALVAIKTFVDVLCQQNKDAELADIVGREMRRVDSIVSQMLRFAGSARPTFAEIGLHEVLDQSLALVQLQLEGRKIHLTKSYEASPAVVRGDSYQLEQAFLNLLLNAIEAMGPDGRLHVVTDVVKQGAAGEAGSPGPSACWLRVRVQDNGVGVAPENRERLFEPFFTTKPNGTGLGLPITFRIIKEHHGSIRFESELNQGTTFTVFLPSAATGP